VDSPIKPGLFALGAGATFIARAVDVDQKGLPSLLNAAQEHSGTAFVEILQNCIVYNKDVFEDVVNKKGAAETQIQVEHGKPLIYGKERDKGLKLNPATLQLESVALNDKGVKESDLMVHDQTNPTLGQMLLTLESPRPVAMGIIHRREEPAFQTSYWAKKPTDRRARVVDLLRRGNVLDHRWALRGPL
jgi:2-oxoglutarate ferredoxin oxidoreductase subunit beta